MISRTKRQYTFNKSVGVVSILLHIFKWKASGKTVLIRNEISMNSV